LLRLLGAELANIVQYSQIPLAFDRAAAFADAAGMDKQRQLTRLLDSGIVAIIRGPEGRLLADVAEALVAGGVEVMEVTFTVPQAHRVLEQVADRLGDKILLGAGTVLDTETARIALLAGAEFIVTPVVRPAVIELCRRYDKLVLPGALTPTEVLTAWEAGADIVKVFPSEVTGPAYLKALHGPLPQVRLMPTGGVNLETAASFLKAGACALGVGGSLIEAAALAAGDFARIESLARQFVRIVRETRNQADRSS
jgi:2-dehydro-3-deoxyphosphogluconate aldolase / (4S)-4-hydroxy-2-oxoglutarate aldolase